MATITPQQRAIARHALGLPNDRCRTYRNGFCAKPNHAAYADLVAMVDAGLARRRFSADFFCITRAGAEAALLPGERLDPEDFPTQGDKP